MKKVALLFLLTIFFSCKHKKPVDPLAIKLSDSALNLYTHSIDTNKKQVAIELLNKATTIDSNYFTAYWNKLSFQMELKQYDNAFITVKRILMLRPKDGDMQALAGNVLEFKGDSIHAQEYFKTSLSLYNMVMDTINIKNRRYKDVKFGKAVDLIMLDRRDEANKLLKQLYDSTTDTLYRQMYLQFINESRKELINTKIENNGTDFKSRSTKI